MAPADQLFSTAASRIEQLLPSNNCDSSIWSEGWLPNSSMADDQQASVEANLLQTSLFSTLHAQSTAIDRISKDVKHANPDSVLCSSQSFNPDKCGSPDSLFYTTTIESRSCTSKCNASTRRSTNRFSGGSFQLHSAKHLANQHIPPLGYQAYLCCKNVLGSLSHPTVPNVPVWTTNLSEVGPMPQSKPAVTLLTTYNNTATEKNSTSFLVSQRSDEIQATDHQTKNFEQQNKFQADPSGDQDESAKTPLAKRLCNIYQNIGTGFKSHEDMPVSPVTEKIGTPTSTGYNISLLSDACGLALNTNGKPRAKRGSATDPQSVYARQRREKINERLKILQNLVPNGAKVDIVTMLEEAINYVKFLQLQVKLLSSDEFWMYAPTTYNGINLSFDLPIATQSSAQDSP